MSKGIGVSELKEVILELEREGDQCKTCYPTTVFSQGSFTERKVYCCSKVVKADGGGKMTSPLEEAEESGIFCGVRFLLAGFEPAYENQFIEELEANGGVNARTYNSTCTHVIVSNLAHDDPICAAARKDGKALVTEAWVADCLDNDSLADVNHVLYRPLKDLDGIPGSEDLCVCLTGYQGQARQKIMRMVELIGARFTKPLLGNIVTHLVCYKFEGEKYELAKKAGLKLINHFWLEDCLKTWSLLPEEDYSLSGWEIENGAKQPRVAKGKAEVVRTPLSQEKVKIRKSVDRMEHNTGEKNVVDYESPDSKRRRSSGSGKSGLTPSPSAVNDLQSIRKGSGSVHSTHDEMEADGSRQKGEKNVVDYESPDSKRRRSCGSGKSGLTPSPSAVNDLQSIRKGSGSVHSTHDEMEADGSREKGSQLKATNRETSTPTEVQGCLSKSEKGVKKKPNTDGDSNSRELDKENVELQRSRDSDSSKGGASKKKSCKKGARVSLLETTASEAQRCFAVGGPTDHRNNLHYLIKLLGAKVCRSRYEWKDDITHVVLPAPLRRTEKVLAAAAAGRWILKPEYVHASRDAGRFLEEEQYEWYGEGTNDKGTVSLDAPRKWRTQFSSTGCGAFYGLRVLFYGQSTSPPSRKQSPRKSSPGRTTSSRVHTPSVDRSSRRRSYVDSATSPCKEKFDIGCQTRREDFPLIPEETPRGPPVRRVVASNGFYHDLQKARPQSSSSQRRPSPFKCGATPCSSTSASAAPRECCCSVCVGGWQEKAQYQKHVGVGSVASCQHCRPGNCYMDFGCHHQGGCSHYQGCHLDGGHNGQCYRAEPSVRHCECPKCHPPRSK